MDPCKGTLEDPFKGTLIDPFKGTIIDPFLVAEFISPKKCILLVL